MEKISIQGEAEAWKCRQIPAWQTGVFAPSLQIMHKSGEGLLLKKSRFVPQFPLLLQRKEMVSGHTGHCPGKEGSSWESWGGCAALTGTLLLLLQSARKETGLKQQEKRDIS